MERDQENYRILQENGWHCIVVWECQLKPKLLEQTMQQVELQLNQNFLSIYQRKSVPYTEPKEEYLMAAEEDVWSLMYDGWGRLMVHGSRLMVQD